MSSEGPEDVAPVADILDEEAKAAVGGADEDTATTDAAAAPAATALQIVNVSDDGNHFILDEPKLASVLSKVPEDMKVSVLAVVGAFRTGKSFVLDIFLRYLQYCEDHPEYDFGSDESQAGHSAWLFSHNTVGGSADNAPADEEAGFKWRSGHDRMTTGIWMWSKHFVVTRPGSNEKIALLVLDTQGLYDLQTSDHLTTSIFGLSTLISSYLVFNVSLQIQEDNMKSLALFAEYARVALHANKHTTRAVVADASAGSDESKGNDDEGVAEEAPFQTVEFLVRDSRLRAKTLPEKLAEMKTQVAKVMDADVNEDIRTTRKQVRLCFNKVSGFYLPYPGEEVSESDTYTGDVNQIRPLFVEMIEAYVRKLFLEQLNVKRIHGREVTAHELRHFFVAYAKSFSEAAIFPKAESLLIATATANNRSFADNGLLHYTHTMDKLCGPRCSYVPSDKLNAAHTEAYAEALDMYDEGTTFGPDDLKQDQRLVLTAQIKKAHARYVELNKSRDPFTNLEIYIVGLGIGLVAYILRVVADSTCGGLSEVCDSASHLFSNIYVVFFSLILFSLAVSWGTTIHRVKMLLAAFGVSFKSEKTKAKQE